MDTSKLDNNISKIVTVLVIIGLLSVASIYYLQGAINEAYAEGIISDIWHRAEQRKNNLEVKTSTSDEEVWEYVEEKRMGRRGYIYTILNDSTTSLVKVETAKKPISAGVCRALKNKLAQTQWMGVFDKVLIVDRMGNEKLDISINDCPNQEIPILRFYVRFAPDEKNEPKKEETEIEQNTSDSETIQSPLPPPVAAETDFSPSFQANNYVPAPTITKINSTSCPSGTAVGGSGGTATASGCRCIRKGESWNGQSCEPDACPEGSSRSASATGDNTNVAGCRCKADTPAWSDGRCVPKCAGDKLLISGKCLCPSGTVQQKGAPDLCVECNDSSDCTMNVQCVHHKCVSEEIKEENDCRWGICQTCDNNTIRQNTPANESCDVAGLTGKCNGNGTCYPVGGRPCASIRACPAGQFCNYGGNLNSTKKQIGKFGQTPNVCQDVEPQEFTYKKTTYYYNSKKDLLSWCRAGNNKPNCMWGYLSKSGAESWCHSLGKRLLTRHEMSEAWDVLKEHLPQTYKGYSYWVQEGAWMIDKKEKYSFTKAHTDGYGGKGGVVCK